MKIQAEIVNGICPTCDEYTPLVGVTKQFYRCLTCGTDLEQKVNGVIKYMKVNRDTEMAIREFTDG